MTYSGEVTADAPLAWWRHGEASGTTMTDSSGNSHPGTYTGSPTLGTTGLAGGDTAMTVNGTTQFGQVAHASWMNVSSITVESVCKPTSVSGVRTMVARRSTSSTNQLSCAWGLRTNGTAAEFFIITALGTTIVTGTSVLATGVTYVIAGSYDPTTGVAKVYVNGTLDATVTITPGTALATPTSDIHVGRGYNSGEFFAGVIDETSIYSSVLSDDRIFAHAAAFIAASTARVSREHVEVLVEVDPDAQVSREHVEVLIEMTPEARVSREHVEVLANLNPDARVSVRRQEVLINPPVPDIRVSTERIEVLYGEARQRITVNKAYEVDTASQIAYPQVVTVNRATETDDARPLTKFIPVGQAEETDEALALHVAFHQSFVIGQASETDAAQQLTRVARREIGQASETDTANVMTLAVGQTVVMGQATETDLAQPFTWTSTVYFNVSVAVDLEEAQQLTLFRKWPVFPAIELDRPLPIYIEWVTNPSGEVLL